MRLAILISVCVLLVAFSIGSIFVYTDWKKDRYDPLILEAATKYDLHPALLKALVHARGRFTYYGRGQKREVGLLQVPDEGVREYKKQVMGDEDFDFGWVCINKAHPPHDPIIRYSIPKTCSICRSPLIPGEFYPKDNIEMGAWYLAELKNKIEKASQANGEKVIPLVLAAYCRTEATVQKRTDNYRSLTLPPDLRSSIKDVLDKYSRYRRKALK